MCIYYMAELVQGKKEHSDWFPERVRILLYGPLRCTAHQLNSLSVFLKRNSKENILTLSRKRFGCLTKTFGRSSAEMGQ